MNQLEILKGFLPFLETVRIGPPGSIGYGIDPCCASTDLNAALNAYYVSKEEIHMNNELNELGGTIHYNGWEPIAKERAQLFCDVTDFEMKNIPDIECLICWWAGETYYTFANKYRTYNHMDVDHYFKYIEEMIFVVELMDWLFKLYQNNHE